MAGKSQSIKNILFPLIILLLLLLLLIIIIIIVIIIIVVGLLLLFCCCCCGLMLDGLCLLCCTNCICNYSQFSTLLLYRHKLYL